MLCGNRLKWVRTKTSETVLETIDLRHDGGSDRLVVVEVARSRQILGI